MYTSSTDAMIIIGETPSVEFVSDEEENKILRILAVGELPGTHFLLT